MFDVKALLDRLIIENRYRETKTFESIQDVKVLHEGRHYHLLGSNNYLSLNGHQALNDIARQVICSYGTGSGGSRLTTGSSVWHKKLEDRIAEFKKAESALVFGAGYMANLGVITGICDRHWTIISDKYNHASIVDGIMLSGARCLRYRHCDIEDLKKKLILSQETNQMIITDSVFSMDGDIAPIEEIAALAKEYDALLVVDDAHGFGVLGERGSGISEYLGLEGEIDLTIGTFSKAVPSSGGYVTGCIDLIDLIRNRARSFIFSTSLPPSVMAVNWKGIELIEEEVYRRKVLFDNISYFIAQMNANGFSIDEQTTPIIPIIIGDEKKAVMLQERLMEEGILIPAIRPPAVPVGTSRLRASINSGHSMEDLGFIADMIGRCARELDIL